MKTENSLQRNGIHAEKARKLPLDKQSSINKVARTAGLFYLLVAVFSGFSSAMRTNLIVPENALATVSKILASESLFRFSIVSDLTGQVFHILLVLALFELLKTVNRNWAMLMLVLALVPVPIAMLNQLNLFAVLGLVNSPDPSQVLFLLNLHNQGVLIAQIFWGLWLFPLGFLVFKSGYLPKVLGILLILAGLGYLVDSLGTFLLPAYNMTLSIYTFVGEILLLLWLLIKGVNVEKWQESLLATS